MKLKQFIDKHFESTTHAQRAVLGMLCGALPILCLTFGLLSCTYGDNPTYLLNSISETYYSNHKAIMLGVLLATSVFLFCYQGYDLGDKVWCWLAALGCLGVAAFPCQSNYYTKVLNLNYVGLFSLPSNISNIVHFIFAFITFGSLAIMTFTQFTKGQDKKRNLIYRICGIIMFVSIIMIPVSGWLNFPGWSTMLWEFCHLESFCFSWLVKSRILLKNL